MPQSKNRKKRVADHQKRLERTRRKLERKRANSFSGSFNVTSEKENVNLELDCSAMEAYFVDSRVDRSPANETDAKTLWSGFSNISNLYSWCQSGLASVSDTNTLQHQSTLVYGVVSNLYLQGVASARDVLFPSRVLRKELEAAQQRMAQLEEELEQVKKAKRRRKSMVSWSSTSSYREYKLVASI